MKFYRLMVIFGLFCSLHMQASSVATMLHAQVESSPAVFGSSQLSFEQETFKQATAKFFVIGSLQCTAAGVSEQSIVLFKSYMQKHVAARIYKLGATNDDYKCAAAHVISITESKRPVFNGVKSLQDLYRAAEPVAQGYRISVSTEAHPD